MFRNTRLRIRQDGYETLEFKEKNVWKIIYTRQSRLQDWELKDEFAVNNPLQNDVNIANEKYDQSTTKQVDDISGVDIDEQVSDEIIENVLSQMLDDINQTVTPTTSEAVSEQDSLQKRLKTKTVDVEKLHARLRTLEKVNEDQRKNLGKKEQELNELRVRNANDDVLNRKEQEINKIQEKLKDVESERDQLLLSVTVNEQLLSDTNERVRELTTENKNVKEKFEKFQQAAEKEKQIAINAAAQEYWETKNEDEERARQQYSESVKRIRADFKEQLRVAENEKTKSNNELLKAQEKIKWLQRAEHKQHSVPDVDLSEREVGGVFAGVMERIDSINDAINNLDPDKPDFEKLVNGNLEALRVQVQEYKQRADNSDGYQKQAYETFQKFTEREIDRINLKLDRKVEGQETLELLKTETDNDYRFKFERLKKWMKDNGLELSSVVISIGSLIAVLATALRKTIQSVTKGAFSFGKSVVKVLSKLGPVFSALENVIMTLLGIASKALMLLGNNLWILLVFLVMFLWKVFEKYRSKK